LIKIAITQRVVLETRINERRDILDQQWTALAEVVGFLLMPVPNRLSDPKAYLQNLNVDGLILTGGNNIGYRSGKKIEGLTLQENDVAYERDYTETEVLTYCIDKNIPVLGVCRGIQFIHSYFGGQLISVDREEHVAKRHELELTDSSFQSIYNEHCQVNSYHNCGIPNEGLPKELIATALYKDQVEALKHGSKEIYGIMWHPEREKVFSEKDILFIKKIFKL
jgi:putative glutamine amidotransferase